MALQATFVADFSNFTDAVAKAEVSLKSFEGNANKVGTSLDRATNSLSGVKIVQQATLAVRAVEELGGVSVLTEKELRRVGATAQEAADKLRAMGQEVPAGIQNIANAAREADEATKKAAKSSGDWMTTLKGAASTLGIAFSVGAITNWAGQVFAAASSIDDLSKKLGVSTSAVQEWDHAAQQTGATIDTVDRAVAFMNKTLAGGSASTIGALHSAGLEFNAIRQMKPEDAFNAIAESVGKIEDPMLRAKVAQELFGKGGQELLPAMLEGWDQLRAGASKMSEETIKRLADAEDAWTKLGNKATIVSGEAISAIFKYFEAWNSPEEAQYAKRFFDGLHLDTERAKKDLVELKHIAETLAGIGGGPAKPAAPKANMPAPLGMPAIDFEADEKALNKIIDAQLKAAKSADEYGKSVRALANELSGAKLAGEVTKLSDAFHALTAEQRKNPDVVKRVAENAQNLQKQGAALTPELFQLTVQTGLFYDSVMKVNPSLDYLSKVFPSVTGAVKDSAQEFAELAAILNDPKLLGIAGAPGQLPGFKFNIEPPEPLPPTFWDEFLGISGESFSQSSRRSADMAIGSLADAIATGDWSRFQENLTFAFSEFAGSAIAAGVNMLVPGLGTLLQPLFSGLTEAVVGMFDRNKGRDLVEDFADSLGGFDVLHAKLAELGTEGDRLWKMLTQGVGRNNPQQAEAAIIAVNKALEEQAKKQKDAQKAAEDTAKAITSSQNKAADELRSKIGDLGKEYDRLFESIKNEAPEEVMGIVETQTREQMATIRKEQEEAQKKLDETLQTTAGTFTDALDEGMMMAADNFIKRLNTLVINPTVSPSGSGTVSGGFGASSRDPIVIHNYTELDGETVAYNQARYLPGVWRDAGVL